MTKSWIRLISCVLVVLAFGVRDVRSAEAWVYYGTYTGEKSKGIYASRLDLKTGTLTPPQLVAETPSPSFLALHPTGAFLYAANEVEEFQGEKAGSITAFAVDPETGGLRPLNTQSSHGTSPCHLVVDRTGRWVLVANYNGGNVAMLPVKDDGSLGSDKNVVIQHSGSSVNPGRQKEPHAHSINLDAGNHFAVAADLGVDRLFVYRFDAGGTLETNQTPFATVAPGSGPRHLAFHPRGRHAFVINELLSTVTAFRWDGIKGVLGEMTTVSTLPAGFTGDNSTAEIQVHPSGRFVYGSNRGHDSIAVFRWDGNLGRLELIENEPTQGKTPRNFGIDPTGKWLLAANQDSDSVVVFRIDEKTGALEPTGQKVEVGAPVCVKFQVIP